MKEVKAYVVTTQVREAVFNVSDLDNWGDVGDLNMADMVSSKPVGDGRPGYIGRIFGTQAEAEAFEEQVMEGRR